jgi:RecB family exonuclease
VWVTLPQLAKLAADPAHAEDLRAWSAFAQALERLESRSPTATLLDHEQLVGHSDFEADPLFEFRTPATRGVTVTTLHRSKGTDFDVVYIANAVEGALPDLRTTDSILGSRHLNPHLPSDAGDYRAFRLDEERRLAYTAMTRASAKVVWTATSSDEFDGPIASRFLPLVAPGTASCNDTTPLTPRSFEATLRRSLNDPRSLDVDRLAAVEVLARGLELGLADPLTRYGTLEPGSDRDLVPDDLRMSPSQAGGYIDCPHRYAVDRYLMTQSEETDYMRFGSLIHHVLEEAEREAYARGAERATADDAVAWLDREWDEFGFGDDAVGLAWRRRAVTMLDDMYRLWPSSARPVGFETPLSLVIDETPWFGRADRIEATEQGVSIVDYKTGGEVTIPEAAVSIQLGYYAMAAAQDPDVTKHGEVVGAAFWYPKKLKKNSITTREFDMDNLDTVRDTMIEITAAIRAEDFRPTPGEYCSKCPVELVCPARTAGRRAFT